MWVVVTTQIFRQIIKLWFKIPFLDVSCYCCERIQGLGRRGKTQDHTNLWCSNVKANVKYNWIMGYANLLELRLFNFFVITKVLRKPFKMFDMILLPKAIKYLTNKTWMVNTRSNIQMFTTSSFCVDWRCGRCYKLTNAS
jgi:hypothetical protein